MKITKHDVEKVIAETIRRFEEESGQAVSELHLRWTNREGGMVIRKVELTAEADPESFALSVPVERSGPEGLND